MTKTQQRVSLENLKIKIEAPDEVSILILLNRLAKFYRIFDVSRTIPSIPNGFHAFAHLSEKEGEE